MPIEKQEVAVDLAASRRHRMKSSRFVWFSTKAFCVPDDLGNICFLMGSQQARPEDHHDFLHYFFGLEPKLAAPGLSGQGFLVLFFLRSESDRTQTLYGNVFRFVEYRESS